jgi:hypothetical protein
MSEQSDKWHATRKARADELFSGRKFEVISEETFDNSMTTPLGYKVKKGYKLRSVDGKEGLQEFIVGKTLLNQIADEYNAVDKPEPKRRGRPRKAETVEQAEKFADREIPADAQQITQPGPTWANPNSDQSL